MTNLHGKVALITGGAHGQGRAHAVRLARAGADVVVLDICAPIESIPYALGTRDELDETIALVEAQGQRGLAVVADVRNLDEVTHAVRQTLETFGRLDIVVANAAVCPMFTEDHPDVWRDTLDVNVTGTHNTLIATIPALINAGGGSIVMISSGLGLAGMATDNHGALAYIASKHAIIGLMRSYANLLGKHWIRVNSVLPSGVATPMIFNDAMSAFHGTLEPEVVKRNALPVELMEPEDIANAVAWLVSDEGKMVTGATLAVDAGWLNFG
jgi:SDR family mycofactocin-dependent oxidoreductase